MAQLRARRDRGQQKSTNLNTDQHLFPESQQKLTEVNSKQQETTLLNIGSSSVQEMIGERSGYWNIKEVVPCCGVFRA